MATRSQQIQYQKLDSNENISECDTEVSHETSRCSYGLLRAFSWLGVLVAFLLLLLTSIQVTLLTINTQRPAQPHIPVIKPQPCGTTADEARTKGCLFAPGLAAWVPPSCYDSELEDEFVAKHPSFDWWYGEGRDPDLTRRIPSMEALSNITNYAFTTWGYHKAHCTHTWKLSHRAIENGWMVRGKIRDYHHPVHCEKILLNTEIPDEKVWTAVSIDFPDCVSYSSICSVGQ
jgi:hypothetical protein